MLGVGLPEKVRGEVRQRAEARLALAQRFLGFLALQELPEEAADRARGVEQLVVGLAHVVPRKCQHADGFALRLGGKSEGGEAAAAVRPPRHAGGARQIARPHRLAGLPAHARALEELLDGGLAREPAVLELQLAARRVESEIATIIPALHLAHCAQRRLQTLRHRARVAEAARHGVLQAQQLLGALLRGDVTAHATVAGESAAFGDDRLARDRDPHRAAVGRDALDLEIAERLAPLELRAVAVPLRAVEVERGLVPARAAEIGRRIATGFLVEAVGDESEAVMLILLPVPVGGKLGQPAKLRFAALRSLVGARRRLSPRPQSGVAAAVRLQKSCSPTRSLDFFSP